MVLRYAPNPTAPSAFAVDSEKYDTSPSEIDVKMEEETGLAMRPKTKTHAEEQATIKIHTTPESNAFVVSIQPPPLQGHNPKRASCDIVLVIDVSGSMSSAAPMPEVEDGDDKEGAGLSVLDLVKHAARTILETLGPDDRLGIVTFSDDATVVQGLTFMSASDKKKTKQRIEALREDSCTNLWAGIRTGLELFSKTELVDNIQGLYVLTDGMPNHMCPKQGYVNKLAPMLKEHDSLKGTVPSIHTFGFGYQIRSELMQSIAEVGKGSYAFIPDAGMIGTAFVHSVANLYSTAGTSASVEVILSNNMIPVALGGTTSTRTKQGQVLRLGNIQYGQSRDLVFNCPEGAPDDTIIKAILTYKTADGSSRENEALGWCFDNSYLPPHLFHYHIYRAQICDFLSTLFPLQANNEHSAIKTKSDLDKVQIKLHALIKNIQSSQYRAVPEVQSLLDDLNGDDSHGQISKALVWAKDANHWQRWGRHYLPSLLHAHQRQLCNTFKDPGPLMYGKDSPLFIKSRTELDAAFDNLPPPKPSRPEKVVYTYDTRGTVTGSRTVAHRQIDSMRHYNSSSAPCFEGNCLVTMGDGRKMPIKSLKPGMVVWTPTGARAIAAVLRTRVRGEKQKICHVGELMITPWHPIQHEGKWTFPEEIAERSYLFKGSVYSLLLAPHPQADGHAIEIGGRICATLGHGLIGRDKNDVRAHAFFGSYHRVALAALRLPRDKNQHVRCGGIVRNAKTGLACGFVQPAMARSVKKGTLNMGTKMRCLA